MNKADLVTAVAAQADVVAAGSRQGQVGTHGVKHRIGMEDSLAALERAAVVAQRDQLHRGHAEHPDAKDQQGD